MSTGQNTSGSGSSINFAHQQQPPQQRRSSQQLQQSSSNGGGRHRRETSRGDSLKGFEKKLSETDAYLQILINQVRDVDSKIQTSTSEQEKRKLVDIKAKTLLLLDKVKLTIVSLQIAKNTIVPEEETRSVVFLGSTPQTPTLKTKGSDSPSDSTNDDANDCDTKLLRHSEKGAGRSSSLVDFSGCSPTSSSVRNRRYEDSEFGEDALAAVCSHRAKSFSSSDENDDDDFFDAAEDTLSTTSSNPVKKSLEYNDDNDKMSSTALNKSGQENSDDKMFTEDGNYDFDKLYDEGEVELDSLDGQGSVISHLLSQVKIGMDLTKVVLPTFILERRSLLEMYADFFAHPDLFVSIADAEEPQDRFVQVVRWYLSAFHAGRKSSVAKKPYNPVLGEIFKCYWDVPNYATPPSDQESELSSNKKLVEDGPVPWAASSNLTFTAEQVSHHPPISTFYTEHIEKKIMCSAYIYTKSAFLGLSIGVHHIGQGSIYLLDKGEEYTITFPSAYGRSILTVPWIELGGSVSINCAQTGYAATIDFITKPFYGGKKHRISGEVFNVSNKKPILNITGEWNGVMHAKWASTGKTEVFVDTKTVPIISKKVQPIAKQESFESRNIWKEVTLALKLRDVNRATAAKSTIEQRQRELVKKRSEDSAVWENRFFHQLGNRWNYNEPLVQRLSTRLYQ